MYLLFKTLLRWPAEGLLEQALAIHVRLFTADLGRRCKKLQQFALNIKTSWLQNALHKRFLYCVGGNTLDQSPNVTDLFSRTRYKANKGLEKTSDILTPKKPPGEEKERKATLTGLRLCDQQKGREKRYLVRE